MTKSYQRGTKWKCHGCKAHHTWKEEDSGQMGARIVEKIEKHIANLEAHGHCRCPSKDELIKKAQKLVQNAVEENEKSD